MLKKEYAFRDSTNDSSPLWCAHVRLTPELLEKLTSSSTSSCHVSLTLNGQLHGEYKTQSSASLSTSKPSILRLNDENNDECNETYELYSFHEDPSVNHVGVFKQTIEDQSSIENGYSIEKIGNIHQKLIVQRLFTTSEQHRMKDRHAKSVLESKSRTSKLLNDSMSNVKIKNVLPSKAKAKNSVNSVLPPSSLSKEEVQAILQNIERIGSSSEDEESDDNDVEKTIVHKTSSPRVTRSKTSVSVVKGIKSDVWDFDMKDTPISSDSLTTPSENSTQRLKRLRPTVNKELNKFIQEKCTPTNASLTPTAGRKSKRPRAHGGVNTRVLPDLSMFSPIVKQICHKVANYISRTVISDEADYAWFVQQHEAFCQDWEYLDKEYSIETIKLESPKIQLKYTTDSTSRSQLETTIEQLKEKENTSTVALAYVKTTMAKIHNILNTLKESIHKYEAKFAACAPK